MKIQARCGGGGVARTQPRWGWRAAVAAGEGFGIEVTGGTPVPLCLLRWLPLGRVECLGGDEGGRVVGDVMIPVARGGVSGRLGDRAERLENP